MKEFLKYFFKLWNPERVIVLIGMLLGLGGACYCIGWKLFIGIGLLLHAFNLSEWIANDIRNKGIKKGEKHER